jgi:histidinol dehydrogenase
MPVCAVRVEAIFEDVAARGDDALRVMYTAKFDGVTP